MANLIYALQNNDGSGIVTEINLSNGFVNATKLCKSAGKNWYDYYRTKRTQDFLKELKNDNPVLENTIMNNHVLKNTMENSSNELILSKVGGNHTGTWVHPDVAIDLASWCSTKFQVAVAKLIRKYMSGELTTAESLDAATLANSTTTLVTSFHTKPVVYVGLIDLPEFFGVKIGSTDDLKTRESCHKREFGNFKLMKVFETLNHRNVERKILDECDAKNIRRSVKINGKTQTELVEIGKFSLENIIEIAKTIVETNPHPLIEEKNKQIQLLENDKKTRQLELEVELTKLKLTKENVLKQDESNITETRADSEKLMNNEKDSVQDNEIFISSEKDNTIHPIQLFLEKYCDLGTDCQTKRFRVKVNELYELYQKKHETFPDLYPTICNTEFNKYMSDELKFERKICTWQYKTYYTWTGIKFKENKSKSFIQKLINEFIEDKCITGPECFVNTKTLYDEFEAYSMDKGFAAIKQNGFSRQNFRIELLKISDNFKVKQYAINGKTHAFTGIQMRNTYNPQDIVYAFVNQKCIKAAGLRIKNIELWEAFQEFIKEYDQINIIRISRNMFYSIIREQNHDLIVKHVTKSDMGFVGISLQFQKS